MKDHVDLENSKSRPDGVYTEVIKKITGDGVCPFCTEHIRKYHPNPIIEREYWLITNNAYPYKPVLHHILLIHKTHISNITEISKPAWDELHAILNEKQSEGIAGGTFMLRFGDTKFTGASVRHLHAHLVQSNPQDPTYDKAKGVITRIG